MLKSVKKRMIAFLIVFVVISIGVVSYAACNSSPLIGVASGSFYQGNYIPFYTDNFNAWTTSGHCRTDGVYHNEVFARARIWWATGGGIPGGDLATEDRQFNSNSATTKVTAGNDWTYQIARYHTVECYDCGGWDNAYSINPSVPSGD